MNVTALEPSTPPAPAPYKGQEESHLIALQYCGMKIHDLLTKHV
ncbi:hypothetical protein [Xylella fastidiosa]|uniref:Uncharacterized protein n=1 Tax=Xylella fastidiosa subsp. fastidiosa TaxID=644356 RepID=A0AAJ5R1G8_XYLFS|nr:hypothetical protein [Xylella fastidiosa]WCF28560.1 hypothetical protein OK117_01255 [Xylella fastidiosa subsp. fastidiosa]